MMWRFQGENNLRRPLALAFAPSRDAEACFLCDRVIAETRITRGEPPGTSRALHS
jgi:hypothetical protein